MPPTTTTQQVDRALAKVYRLRSKALLKLAPDLGLSPPQILLLAQLPVTQQRALVAEKVRERIGHCVGAQLAHATRCFQRLVRQHTGVCLRVPDARRLVAPLLVAPDPPRCLRQALHTVVAPPPAAAAAVAAATPPLTPHRLLATCVDMHLLPLQRHLAPCDRRAVHAHVLRNLRSSRGYAPSPASLLGDKRVHALVNVANDISKKLTGTDVATLALQTGGAKMLEQAKARVLGYVQKLGEDAVNQVPCLGKLRTLPVTDAKELGEFMRALLSCLGDFRALLQKPFDAYCKSGADSQSECDRLLAQVDGFDALLDSVRKVVADLASFNISSSPEFQTLLTPLGPELRKLMT